MKVFKFNIFRYFVFQTFLSNFFFNYRRCRLTNNMCEGEDCFNRPSAYTYNFITFVSKMMVPPEGRTFFSLKGPIWYDDIEFDMKIVKTVAAANIEKATPNHFG